MIKTSEINIRKISLLKPKNIIFVSTALIIIIIASTIYEYNANKNEIYHLLNEYSSSILNVVTKSSENSIFSDSEMENLLAQHLLGVAKNATKEEIIVAISEIMNGESYFSEEVENLLNVKTKNAPLITRREKEVLELIAQGMTNPEIAEKIFVSSSTVDTHRKNLILKLEAKNTADLVRLAFKYELIS